MSKKQVMLGLVQTNCSTDPAENLQKTMARISEAADRGAQIVCTQELFRSQYFCQTEDHDSFALAETIPGPTTEALCRLAREREIVIVASLFERRAAGIYHNTAVVIDADGALLGKYRKMHIPDDPLYYEKFYFTPGDLGFKVFETRYANVGTLVCWDQWFPEAARLTSLQGADILFYPTAIGWHPSEREKYGERQRNSWETIQRGHAIANGVYVAAVNRVGHEGASDGGIDFWGGTFVSDPSGQVIAKADASAEEVLVVPIDLENVEQARVHWPFLRDRRVDAYDAIKQRYIDRDTTGK